MRFFQLLPLVLLFFSCVKQNGSSSKEGKTTPKNQINVQEFQTILDSANVEGSILIYDLEQDKYYSNDFERSKKGNLPASTFKITNSIIALETGVIENDSTLLKWNGEKRRLKIWEQDLLFREAFHFSCVPCYQQIAREIGTDRMKTYLKKLDYESMVIDTSSIDLFWLVGDSRINQLQQIDFLKRFYKSELQISNRTEIIMKRLMVIEQNTNYTLSGKTGWSIRNENNNGWFVGYLEENNKAYFFATNIEPKETFNMKMFPMIRKEITYKALQQMKLMN